ncbi:MAG: hypothetical protein Fur0044_00950 [Anaerolineae bacterium]
MSKLVLSSYATDQMYRVRRRLNLEGKDDLYTLRIALARSIQLETKLKTTSPVEAVARVGGDGKRKEITIPTLVQKDSILFRALLQQFYKRKLTDDEYQELLLRHIEHGLEVIDSETENFKGYEYLAAIAQSGIYQLKSPPVQPETATQSGFSDVLSIRVGVEKNTSQPIVINFNKTDEHSNNYVGIVGKPGSGKTYFAKYFLTELRKASRFETNFVIFDYAKGDIADDSSFVANTRAGVLAVDKTPIPINIFTASTAPAPDKRFSAEKIVRTIRDVEANIGKVQENNLYEAIMNAYQRAASESIPHPDFQLVREELEAIRDTPDSLTSVFRPLTEHNLFATWDRPTWDSLLDKTVIFDIHRLPALKDLCVFLVLNEMYRQLMLLPDSKVDPVSKAREMRTMIVIDEAHHFLKSKKRVSVLENIIREIRSKGASVMLLSQSPDDYDQTEFNFLELLEFIYVLESNPSSPKFLQQAFGLSLAEAKNLIRNVTELNQGEAFGKSKENKVTHILLCK